MEVSSPKGGPSSEPSWVALAGVCQCVSRRQVLDLWAHRESQSSPHRSERPCDTYVCILHVSIRVLCAHILCVHISCIGATPLSAFRAAGGFPVLPRHRRIAVPTPARAFCSCVSAYLVQRGAYIASAHWCSTPGIGTNEGAVTPGALLSKPGGRFLAESPSH